MTPENKQEVLKCIDNLHTEGSTNLGDGLFKGMEELKKNKGSGRNAGVFLLTDGQPNIEPPRGHIPMLQKYQDENPDITLKSLCEKFRVNQDKLSKDISAKLQERFNNSVARKFN